MIQGTIKQGRIFIGGTIQMLLIIAVLFFLWKGWDTVVDWKNRIQNYEALEKANKEFEKKIDAKNEEIESTKYVYEALLADIGTIMEENTKLREESDNAKANLRKKDIVGNFDNWISDSPDNFRNRVTNASNRVLNSVGSISARNQSSGKGGNPKKSALPDANSSKNTYTKTNVAPGSGSVD